MKHKDSIVLNWMLWELATALGYEPDHKGVIECDPELVLLQAVDKITNG